MMEDSIENIKHFCDKLSRHAERKAILYDGVRAQNDIGACIRFLMEEMGELSSAVTRERWLLAQAECIDVAHCAMLAYLALDEKVAEVAAMRRKVQERSE